MKTEQNTKKKTIFLLLISEFLFKFAAELNKKKI